MVNQEEKTKSNQNQWNILFSLIYTLAFVGCVFVLYRVNGTLPTSIKVFDFLLIILAAYRFTRLFVYDHIMQFFRDWFLDKEYYKDERGAIRIHRYPPLMGPRRTINDLLSCPWCFGVWSGLLVPFFYFLTPYAWFVILVFAISGASTFIQVTANLIGWSAEYKKKKTTLVESRFD